MSSLEAPDRKCMGKYATRRAFITYNWRSHVHILKKTINQQVCMGKLSLGYISMFGATIIILTTVLYNCTTNMCIGFPIIFRGKSPFL